MVTNALVALPSEARAAGWNLWDAIHSSPDLQVTALFWAQFDEDDWRIYLASPRVAAEGQRVIYRQLQQIMDKLPEEDLHGLELSDIVVTTPDDRVVREMGRRYGAGEGDRRTIRRLSLSAEEAYVYHLEQTTSSFLPCDLASAARHTVAAKTQRLPMTLFEAAPNPVVGQIQCLDLSTLSPIEALNLLYKLQKDAREK